MACLDGGVWVVAAIIGTARTVSMDWEVGASLYGTGRIGVTGSVSLERNELYGCGKSRGIGWAGIGRFRHGLSQRVGAVRSVRARLVSLEWHGKFGLVGSRRY